MRNKIIKLSILLPFLAALSVHAKLENKLYTKDIYKQDIRAQLNKLKTSNSLIITDPKILALLEEEHSLGQKLGELAYYEGVLRVRKWQGDIDSPRYILNAFKDSDAESRINNRRMDENAGGKFKDIAAFPVAKNFRDAKTKDGVVKTRFRSLAIGVNKKTNITPYQNIINLWPALKEAENGKKILGTSKERYDPKHLGKGPFRLLAVVNRMDLSGNLPRGSGPFGFAMPRAFGEVHFIYGVVDKNYERLTKTAYPHTFQVTYQLPPLDYKFNVKRQWQRTSPNGGPADSKGVKISTHEEFMLAGNHNKWRNNNQRWGWLWRQLSRIDIRKQPQTFANHLHAMLLRSATPINFLNMNSNAAIGGSYSTRRKQLAHYEFELKAYYASRGSEYNHRGQRSREFRVTEVERDSFRCAINAPYLRNLVNEYMVTYPKNNHYFKKPVRDLMAWNPDYATSYYDENNIAKKYTNYSGLNSYMLGNNTSYNNKSLTHPGLDGSKNGITGSQMVGCTDESSRKNPYLLFDKQNVISPRMTRTKWNFVWDFPKKRGLENVPEEGRHAFAIRTCSGCHGKETRTNGFHIQNRLDNKTPKLSGFLNDNGVTTDKLVGNVRYRYNTIKHRKEWLYLSVERKNTIRAGMSLVRKSDERL